MSVTDPPGPRLQSSRLLLRRWTPQDLAPFAALNADPETMRYFPSTLTRPQSDELAGRIEKGFDVFGFGMWAVEVLGVAPFIGFVGLAPVGIEIPCKGSVEIGWRLSRAHWHRGYATEAAKAVLDFAFLIGLAQVVSFTAVINAPSRAVMVRLGMSHDPADDFVHPLLPTDHRLQPHVLYRMARDDWPDARSRLVAG